MNDNFGFTLSPLTSSLCVSSYILDVGLIKMSVSVVVVGV